MSDNREQLRPYEEAFRELASDKMAEAGIPQRFWPAQTIKPKRAIEAPTEEGSDG